MNTHRGLCSSEISLLHLPCALRRRRQRCFRRRQGQAEPVAWGPSVGRCSPASIPCPIRLQAPGRAALLCQEHTRQPDAAASPHLAHTEEKRQERWASRGSRWAPVSSHMSGDQCFGLCINQKKKTKKGKREKTPTFCKIFNHVVLRCYVEKKIWQLFPFFPE